MYKTIAILLSGHASYITDRDLLHRPLTYIIISV